MTNYKYSIRSLHYPYLYDFMDYGNKTIINANFTYQTQRGKLREEFCMNCQSNTMDTHPRYNRTMFALQRHVKLITIGTK